MDAFADKPIALPEGIDMENHVIATYWIEADRTMDMALMGQILAIEQTTGTWVPVPGETPEVRAKHVAKVIGVYEAPYYEYGRARGCRAPAVYHADRLPLRQCRRPAPHDAHGDHRQHLHGAQFQAPGLADSQGHAGPVQRPEIRHRRLVEGAGH